MKNYKIKVQLNKNQRKALKLTARENRQGEKETLKDIIRGVLNGIYEFDVMLKELEAQSLLVTDGKKKKKKK